MAGTDNSVTKSMLVSELQNLLRLTAFEQAIATVRRTQAASTPIAEELRANAQKAVERSRLLQDAVRQAGAVPDVVGAALSRAGAFVQTQVNQVQTLQGALLGDLALEHQLRERTRYARTLAETLGYYQVLPVLDRLETAHTATIEWLETRLDEVGRTGTSALRATPVQALVGSFRRVAGVPFAVFAAGVNRGSSLLHSGARSAGQTAAGAAETASSATQSAIDAAHSAVGTASSAAQSATATAAGAAGSAVHAAAQGVSKAADTTTSAAAEGVSKAADATTSAADTAAAATRSAAEQVIDLTDIDESKAPFAGYETLSGDSVIRHVRDSEDVDHLREILAFEQAHKSRKGVLGALEDRLAQLSGSSTSA